jgi:Endonuclease/Exonuclease/phosphatase family
LVAATVLSHCANDSEQQAPLETSSAALTVHTASKKVTIGTWNIFARPEAPIKDVGMPRGYQAHADSVVRAVRANPPDVLAFNELFDDGVREIVRRDLEAMYPHHVSYVDFTGDIALQDSGLALFSRFPFEQLGPNLPLSDFAIKTTDGRLNSPTSPKAFSAIFDGILFSECEGSDCHSSKGAGLVRLALPWNKLNLVFTHMQADNPGEEKRDAEIRKEQLYEIGKLLNNRLSPAQLGPNNVTMIMGDTNVPGLTMQGPEYLDVAKQPTIGNRTFIDGWRTTSSADKGMSHVGLSPERYDYALLDQQTIFTPGQPGPQVPVVDNQMCAQWIRRAFSDGPSDHIGLLVDLGPQSAACQPGKAVPLTFTGVSVPRTDTLPQPGSVMWYRIEEPDTFSVGFKKGTDAARDLRIDVYSEDDLSKPIEPFDKVNRGSGYLCPVDVPNTHICKYDTTTYFPPKRPVYLRVYDPKGLRSGNYDLILQPHNCASSRFACALRASDTKKTVSPPANVNYTGYFMFTTDRAVDGAPQELKVNIDNPANTALDVVLSRSVGLASQVVFKNVLSKSDTIKRNEADAATYFLAVKRATGAASFSVSWNTNLYYVVGAAGPLPTLACAQEGDDTAGDDEIRFRVFRGGTQLQQEFFSGFDKSDSQPVRIVGPFVGNIDVEVAELAGETVDSPVDTSTASGQAESATKTLFGLAPTQFEERNKEMILEFVPHFPAHGDYRFRYSLVHSLR